MALNPIPYTQAKCIPSLFFYSFIEMGSSILKQFPMMGNSLPCNDPLPILKKYYHNY